MLVLAATLAAAPESVATRPDSSTTRPNRVVRRFGEIVVRSPLRDPRSSETLHVISGAATRALPVDRLADLIALQPGVVAQGGALHVRGGRAGDLEVSLDGIALNEPLRGRPFELPLVVLRDANLVTGGMDAEYGGALAGVLDVHTVDPGKAFEGELRWNTDGRRGTEYDHAAARIGGPSGIPGLGFVAAGEATLDGTALPSLRSASRRRNFLGDFGWRADNRMTGYLQIAPIASHAWKLQGLASRRVLRPYDPMWSVDAWIHFCPGLDSLCAAPYVGPDSIPGATHYRAADHKTITDERSQVMLLSIAPLGWGPSATLAWMRTRSITSLDGRDAHAYVDADRKPTFGDGDSPYTDPFLVYQGDEPYFRRSRSDVLELRADRSVRTRRGTTFKTGAGLTYETVSSYEFDGASRRFAGVDTLRAYRAWAPGGFAYAQSRWDFQGLALNLGLRAQMFDPGAIQGATPWPVPARTRWSLSPRLGLAYPLSTRDAFSLSYTRIDQNPGRDFLYESRRVADNHRPLANPRLVPSTVISYQMALQHVLDRDWTLQIALFYRDLFGQVGARNYATRGGFRLGYTNADEGHANGFELSARRLWGAGNRIEVHYTWLEAWGTASREEGVPYGTLLGSRASPIGDHPLDWDRRHTLTLIGSWRLMSWWTLAWDARGGSGLPWTPVARRAFEPDLTALNTGRLAWSETTALALRCEPTGWRGLSIGVDVQNLFDERVEVGTTVDGYPNATINTLYDDYSAYRTATGRGGGAYWDDRDGDGLPGWIAVHDPRLSSTPRTIRASLSYRWAGAGD